MANSVLQFQGMAIRSVKGTKAGLTYTTFKIAGKEGTQFQVSSLDEVGEKDIDVMCDWELHDIVPVAGVRDGRSFAYFKVGRITARRIKSGKEGG